MIAFSLVQFYNETIFYERRVSHENHVLCSGSSLHALHRSSERALG